MSEKNVEFTLKLLQFQLENKTKKALREGVNKKTSWGHVRKQGGGQPSVRNQTIFFLKGEKDAESSETLF